MLISIKKQSSNNVRIHTSDSTGKDLNEVNLHNTQEPSKINEHLLECISLTIKTKGLKKIIYDRIYSLFFLTRLFHKLKKFQIHKSKKYEKGINTFVRNGELFHEVTAFLKREFGQMQSKNEVISII